MEYLQALNIMLGIGGVSTVKTTKTPVQAPK